MKKHKVFLGSPCYRWPPDPHYGASVQETQANPSIDLEFRTVIGDADINRARACVLKHFLELDTEKQFDYFLNVYWDIEFRSFDLVRACERMEKFGLDIIGGPYPYKSDADGKKECIVFRCDPAAKPDENYILPCEFVGGGYMLVRASFLRKMCSHYDDLRFNLNPDLDPKRSSTYLLWRNDLLPRPDWGEGERELLSEDYSFCNKAKNRLDKSNLDAKLHLTVHDEVIVEAREDHAAQAKHIVEQSIKDGFGRYFHLIPMETDALQGPCWLKSKCEAPVNGKKCNGTEMVFVADSKYKNKIICKKCGADL